MAITFERDEFGKLPLWAQVVLAARAVRRGTLAMAPGETDPVRVTALAACDTAEWCAQQGGSTSQVSRELDRAEALRDQPMSGGARAIGESVWWLVDSARAAEAAQDFPIDSTVTNSALKAIESLKADARVNQMQLMMLLASDLDQLRFACGEIATGRYDGLSNHVFGRLAPVHAITLKV